MKKMDQLDTLIADAENAKQALKSFQLEEADGFSVAAYAILQKRYYLKNLTLLDFITKNKNALKGVLMEGIKNVG